MRRSLLVVAAAGALFGVASAVQASVPSSNRVIHGCYGKTGTQQKGILRVIDGDVGEHCRYYENPLDWNVAGGTGPAGATGPTGPAGPPQDPDVYETRVDQVPVAVSPAQSHVATLSPPPGNYLVTALGTATWTSVAPLDVACDLYKNTNAGTLLSTAWMQGDDGIAGTIALRDVASVGVNDTLDIYCRTVDVNGHDNVVQDLRLTATTVGTVTTQ